MSLNNLLIHSILIVLLGLIPQGGATWAGNRSENQQPGSHFPRASPNIIFILADDLGYGDVGFNGQRLIKTPEIDRLASEGMVFRQHYSGAPVCTPSRYSLMTGKFCNRMDRSKGKGVLHQNEETVEELLREAGYRTHFIGKWGLGGADISDDPHMNETGLWPAGTGSLLPGQESVIPTRRGFDTSLAYLNQAYAHWYFPTHLWQNGKRMEIKGNQSPTYSERTVYSHNLFLQEAKSLIRGATGDTPFYLQISFTLPHRETKPPPGTNPYASKEWPEVEKAFAWMVTYLDQSIGEIMNEVDHNDAIRNNTLVIFSSDNGPQYTDGHDPYFFDSNGPLRGNKSDLYEGGIRVPTVARWKGVIPPGSSTEHVSAFCDFPPTCVELVETEPPEDIDGISFAPILRAAGTQEEHEFLYWEFAGPQGGPKPSGQRETVQRQAVRMGDWKLIVPQGSPAELYDLSGDPRESVDLSSKHPEVLKRLLRIARNQASPRIRELLAD
ncbi:MAG: arylsulfatase [Candidatus Omnitrophica bacterium]|nr:arylsulfatase [Candidatus Omnitrophota bacterium]